MLKKIFSVIFLFAFAVIARGQQLPDSVVWAETDTITQLPTFTPEEESIVVSDTLSVVTEPAQLSDSLVVVKVREKKEFKPDPTRTIWMGALIPGFGQIANKKYWKLPFVYGGFMGFGYAINWNHGQYMAFKNGYIDITDGDPNTNYHLKLLPRGYTLENFPGGEETFKNRLRSSMDYFHRYRDLSIILATGFYALVLLDAYVDAQLYDFNISPDLVLNVAPARLEFDKNQKAGFGVQASIRF